MTAENGLGLYFKHINDVLQRDCNNSLRSKGLTMSQMNVLDYLNASADGQMPLKELEKKLQVAQPTAAGIIARMEQKGLVQSCSGTDRRIKIVTLTDEGRRCFESSLEDAEESETHLTSALTEEEKILLSRLLKKVSDSL